MICLSGGARTVCVPMENRNAGDRVSYSVNAVHKVSYSVCTPCIVRGNISSKFKCLWCYKGLRVAAGPSCSAMELEPILSLLPPRAINNPARGCQMCNCASTTWTPALYSLAINRKGCFVCEIRVYNLYICNLCRSPGFCSEPHWATAVLYPHNIEDSVCNYYLSNKDLKLRQATFHVGSL